MNNPEREFKYWQNRILLGTIVGYAIFYLVRKNLSMAMPGLQADLDITKAQLGIFLTLHGLIYGISKFLSGFSADKLSSRHLLVSALLLCSICNFIFGFSSSLMILGIFWILNGLFQGFGFPPIARLLAYWIHPKQLATKMSIWQTSHSIGAALAVIICGYVVSFGWRWCFYIPAVLALLGVVWMWITIRNSPKDVGLPEIDEFEHKEQQKNVQSNNKNTLEYKQLLMKKVFKNKVIWILAIANFPVYALRFVVLDWGPTILKEWKGLSLFHAGWMVASFEIAGILGVLAAGRATDKYFDGKAHRVCLICITLASVFMFLFWKMTTVPTWIYMSFLILSGFFLYGAQALGTIATSKTATRKVSAAACGFHGFWGYLSVIATGWGFGSLTDAFGWSYSIGALIILGFSGVILFALIWNAKADGYDDM
ncbi:MAG: MFS transporter [Endomicrobium sp.]|jgi:OPA family glycerol-3-phosphate transporter-like MFS transporter/OPA family sugar phosphate sensor protein UhpC-like MFS transporter|nr:MFS transporter [Endomicrobium sp.]